jgi:hypothetical protein
MPLERFDAPGFLEDYSAEQKAAWSEFMSELFDAAVRGQPEELEFDGPREQF